MQTRSCLKNKTRKSQTKTWQTFTAILERNLVYSWPQADQLRSQAHTVGCMHSSLAATHDKTGKPCLLAQ
jgi:hypothetical protein